MEKFEIYYNSGLLTCFYRTEEFESYEDAVRIVKENNKYDVAHPDLIRITRL